MNKTSPLDDRRQSAREAFYDVFAKHSNEYYKERAALEAAIEAATRVQITPEIREAMVKEMTITLGNWEASLAAAFRAAGFEVVE